MKQDRTNKEKFKHLWILGIAIHILTFLFVLDLYFTSPIKHGMTPHKSQGEPLAKRIVVFIADGLRAEAIYSKENWNRVEYLSDLRLNQSCSWGIVHTGVPTESRPGHVAIFGGLYEDPSAIMTGWQANTVEFDSVINESNYAWSYGSPDIVKIFTKKDKVKLYVDHYNPEQEDFSGRTSTINLDTWVFDRIEELLAPKGNSCDAKEIYARIERQKLGQLQKDVDVQKQRCDEQMTECNDEYYACYKKLEPCYIDVKAKQNEVADKLEKMKQEMKVREICEENVNREDEHLNKQGNIFFLHLLGMDTAGHVHKPDSREYLANLKALDTGIRNIVLLFDAYFNDNETVYLFTSDHGMTNWGSHGDGSAHETEVPYILWGKGVHAYKSRNDLKQADLAPLIASLIGIPIPVNSVGVLPYKLLHGSYEQIAEAVFANVMQHAELYKLLLQEFDRDPLFEEYAIFHDSDYIEKAVGRMRALLEHGDPERVLVKMGEELMKDILDANAYMRNFHFKPKVATVMIGFLLWMFYLALATHAYEDAAAASAVVKKYDRWQVSSRVWIPLLMAAAVVYLKGLNVNYFTYLYPLFPLAMLALFGEDRDVRSYLRRILQMDGNKGTFIVRSLLYGCLVQLLVLGFFYRIACAGVLLILAMWLTQNDQPMATKVSWMTVACMLAVLQVIEPSTKFKYYGLAIGSVLWLGIYLTFIIPGGSAYIKFFDLKYKRTTNNVIAGPLFIYLIAVGNTCYVAYTFDNNVGHSDWNLGLSWMITGLSCLIIPLAPCGIHTRFAHIAACLIVPYTLMSVNIDLIFFGVLVLTLYYWMESEAYTHPSRMPLCQNHFATSYAPSPGLELSAQYRRTYFYLSLTVCYFFAIGNMASFSGFDPQWTRTYVATFNPFVMTALIIVKMIIPFFLITCALYAICVHTRANYSNVFIILLLFLDQMVLNFMLFVRNEGSWKDIGKSLSHFAVMEAMALVMLVFFALAKYVCTFRIGDAGTGYQPSNGRQQDGVHRESSLEEGGGNVGRLSHIAMHVVDAQIKQARKSYPSHLTKTVHTMTHPIAPILFTSFHELARQKSGGNSEIKEQTLRNEVGTNTIENQCVMVTKEENIVSVGGCNEPEIVDKEKSVPIDIEEGIKSWTNPQRAKQVVIPTKPIYNVSYYDIFPTVDKIQAQELRGIYEKPLSYEASYLNIPREFKRNPQGDNIGMISVPSHNDVDANFYTATYSDTHLSDPSMDPVIFHPCHKQEANEPGNFQEIRRPHSAPYIFGKCQATVQRFSSETNINTSKPPEKFNSNPIKIGNQTDNKDDSERLLDKCVEKVDLNKAKMSATRTGQRIQSKISVIRTESHFAPNELQPAGSRQFRTSRTSFDSPDVLRLAPGLTREQSLFHFMDEGQKAQLVEKLMAADRKKTPAERELIRKYLRSRRQRTKRTHHHSISASSSGTGSSSPTSIHSSDDPYEVLHKEAVRNQKLRRRDNRRRIKAHLAEVKRRAEEQAAHAQTLHQVENSKESKLNLSKSASKFDLGIRVIESATNEAPLKLTLDMGSTSTKKVDVESDDSTVNTETFKKLAQTNPDFTSFLDYFGAETGNQTKTKEMSLKQAAKGLRRSSNAAGNYVHTLSAIPEEDESDEEVQSSGLDQQTSNNIKPKRKFRKKRSTVSSKAMMATPDKPKKVQKSHDQTHQHQNPSRKCMERPERLQNLSTSDEEPIQVTKPKDTQGNRKKKRCIEPQRQRRLYTQSSPTLMKLKPTSTLITDARATERRIEHTMEVTRTRAPTLCVASYQYTVGGDDAVESDLCCSPTDGEETTRSSSDETRIRRYLHTVSSRGDFYEGDKPEKDGSHIEWISFSGVTTSLRKEVKSGVPTEEVSPLCINTACQRPIQVQTNESSPVETPRLTLDSVADTSKYLMKVEHWLKRIDKSTEPQVLSDNEITTLSTVTSNDLHEVIDEGVNDAATLETSRNDSAAILSHVPERKNAGGQTDNKNMKQTNIEVQTAFQSVSQDQNTQFEANRIDKQTQSSLDAGIVTNIGIQHCFAETGTNTKRHLSFVNVTETLVDIPSTIHIESESANFITSKPNTFKIELSTAHFSQVRICSENQLPESAVDTRNTEAPKHVESSPRDPFAEMMQQLKKSLELHSLRPHHPVGNPSSNNSVGIRQAPDLPDELCNRSELRRRRQQRQEPGKDGFKLADLPESTQKKPDPLLRNQICKFERMEPESATPVVTVNPNIPLGLYSQDIYRKFNEIVSAYARQAASKPYLQQNETGAKQQPPAVKRPKIKSVPRTDFSELPEEHMEIDLNLRLNANTPMKTIVARRSPPFPIPKHLLKRQVKSREVSPEKPSCSSTKRQLP